MVDQSININTEDPVLLKGLIERYPYHQPFHLMLAKATMGKANEQAALATAALYTNGQLLHNIIFKKAELSEKRFNVIEYSVAGEVEMEPVVMLPVSEEAELEEISLLADADEQEIFDEIGELDYKDYETTHKPHDRDDTISTIETAETLEEELVLESILSTDFFAFEQNIDSDALVPEVETTPNVEDTQALEVLQTPVLVTEDSRVSNYHDDKLPYTFLWWLAKTRKEYQSFQPYVTVKKQPSNDLQQQYVEHIFHIQSPFNAEEILNNTAEIPQADPKEVEIIDNFIKNAPQIGTLKAEQIDNENKARKSAEDHNDVVSETLAKIYIEQMLYHKALETYEKLSLKFPEKSRYFADLIQSIKKKI